MIVRNPLPPKRNWRWVFIICRQIGEYKVAFEWIQQEYFDKGGLNYSIEYRTKDGQVLHTEFGQHAPEW